MEEDVAGQPVVVVVVVVMWRKDWRGEEEED